MLQKLVAIAVLVSILASMMAGLNGAQAGTSFKNRGTATFVRAAPSRKLIKRARGTSAVRKSDRQKCLDKMLPQDGVDCLKKLKAKK